MTFNPRLNDYELLPNIAEASFEDFSLDLFQELWNDPDAQPVGKRGSGQDGVDVSGQLNGTGDYVGAQCKNKEQLTGKKLTEKEVLKEIEKAKGFKPPLKEYVIITTCTRDAELQELVRNISYEHQQKGLFRVKIYFWEDVVKKLKDNAPKTLASWYPHLAVNQTAPAQTSEMQKAQIEVMEGAHSSGNKVNVVGSNNTITINPEPVNKSDDVHNAKIDSARDFIDTHNPEKALEILNELKATIWSTASEISKFRITTNIGVALSQTGKMDETARYFIEALQYNPEDEKALLNAATGYLILDNIPEARKKIKEVIDKNPMSARSWSLLLETYENDPELENIKKEVPQVLEKDFVINNTLARLSMSKNDLVGAEGYLRKAIIADTSGNQDLETKVRLAEVLLQQVLDDEIVVFGGHLNDETKKRAEEALQLFNDAWGEIDTTEIKKYKTGWLINRSIAKRLLGDKEGSFDDIELAIKTNPEEVAGVRAKASLLFETGKQTEAIRWLEENEAILEKDPSLTFLLAGFLRETDQFDKAINVLEKLLTRKDGETKNHDAKRLLIQIYLDRKDYDNAEKVLTLIPSEGSSQILKILEGAKIKRYQGLENEAVQELVKAKNLFDESTSRRQKLEIANALYSLKEYVLSAELYKELVVGVEDDELTNRYLNALYFAGKYVDALDIAEKLKEKTGLTKSIVQLETAIYDDIGDTKKSEALCLEYLLAHPDDTDVKLRLAIVKYRLHKEADIKEILSTIGSVDTLEFSQVTQIVNLYREVGDYQTSLKLAYELRRRFYSDPEAHLFYINSFFAVEKEGENLFSPQEVVDDTFVTIKDAQGAQTSYLVENRKDPDFRSHEITKESNTDLYEELAGKKVGEKLNLKNQSLEVTEIKSKYVYALQESLKTYNTHFPKAKGLVGFNFDSSTPETTSESIQTMLDQVTAVANMVAPIEKAYKDGQITIGAFAELLHKNPIEIFSGLMSLPNTHIRVALGTKEEYETSIGLMASYEKPQLIIDITALITIHGIGVADQIVKHYGKLGITQSTIDHINETISDRRGMKSKGFMSIGKEGDQFVKDEITPEQIAEGIQYFEKISKWIDENCILVASKKARPLSEKKDTEELLGKSFIDTISIAAEKEYILFTDDERLRSYAKSEYKIDGVWTQFVLMELLKKEVITMEEYADAVIKLVNSKYQHTSINKDIVFRAGEKAGWNMEDFSLSRVMLMLSEAYTDPKSAIIVMADLIVMMWLDLTKNKTEKEKILSKVLDVFIGQRDKISILPVLLAVVYKSPMLDARMKAEIRDFMGRFNSNEIV